MSRIDPLEPRRHFAATSGNASVRFQDGTLYVFGTGGDDRITVEVSAGGRLGVLLPATLLAVPVGDTPRLRDVAKVFVDAGAGDDVVDLGALSVGAEVRGGTGDDTIAGGSGDDLLYGDSGRDYLTDGRGHDVLAGGSGSDVLRARRGPDTLLGGNGNDRLLASGDEDVLDGGSGEDSAYLGGVPDAVGHVEFFSADSLYFPAGATRRTNGSVSAYLDGRDALLLDASLTLGRGFAIDWDLTPGRDGRYGLDATPYRMNTASFEVPPLTGTYRRTFDLGFAGALDPLGVRVTLNALGRNLFVGNTLGYGDRGYDAGFVGAGNNYFYNGNGAYNGTGYYNGLGYDPYGTGLGGNLLVRIG